MKSNCLSRQKDKSLINMAYPARFERTTPSFGVNNVSQDVLMCETREAIKWGSVAERDSVARESEIRIGKPQVQVTAAQPPIQCTLRPIG